MGGAENNVAQVGPDLEYWIERHSGQFLHVCLILHSRKEDISLSLSLSRVFDIHIS